MKHASHRHDKINTNLIILAKVSVSQRMITHLLELGIGVDMSTVVPVPFRTCHIYVCVNNLYYTYTFM